MVHLKESRYILCPICNAKTSNLDHHCKVNHPVEYVGKTIPGLNDRDMNHHQPQQQQQQHPHDRMHDRLPDRIPGLPDGLPPDLGMK